MKTTVPRSVSSSEMTILAALKDSRRGMTGIELVKAADGAIDERSVYRDLARLKTKGYLTVLRPDRPKDQPGRPRPLFKLSESGKLVVMIANTSK